MIDTTFEKKIRFGMYDNTLPYGPSKEAKQAYLAKEAELLKQFLTDAEDYVISLGVPEKYAHKVVEMAYREGHVWGIWHSGLYEVYIYLLNLADIFV